MAGTGKAPMNTLRAAPAQRRSSTPVWVVLVVFAAPFSLALLFFFNPSWLPGARTNFGALIQPPVALPGAALRTSEGENSSIHALKGQWTLIVVVDSDCGKDCRETVHSLRQIRLALGEEKARVERLLIALHAAENPTMEELGKAYPGMHFLAGGSEEVRQFAALFSKPGFGTHNNVYIADPMGNLMMKYGPDSSPEHVLKDVEKLLKASKNWATGKSYRQQ